MSAPMEEEPRTIRNKGIIIKRKKKFNPLQINEGQTCLRTL